MKYPYRAVFVLALACLATGAAVAQEIEIGFLSVSALEIEKTDGGFRFKPKLVWDVFKYGEGGWQPVERSQLENTQFRVYGWRLRQDEQRICDTDSMSYMATEFNTGPADGWRYRVKGRFTFEDREYGFDEMVSDVAELRIVPDTPSAGIVQEHSMGELLLAIFTPLFPVGEKIPEQAVVPDGAGQIYTYLFMAKKAADNSGLGGTFSFNLIRIFILISAVIVVRGLWKLRLSHLLPMKYDIHIIHAFTRGRRYDRFLIPKFRSFVERWTEACADIHRSLHDANIKALEGSVGEFDPNRAMKSIWVGDNGEGGMSETFKDLQDDLKDLQGSDDPKKHTSPTLAVIEAGLKNQINNALNWYEASEEVDRAFEARADEEISHLKRETGVEWLWHMASIAPLAGLLGTVTGISFAFMELADAGEAGGGVVSKLAPSINEALWTTIFGLMVAIVLMLCHSFFMQKINWVASKWQEIIVKIAEEL